MKHALLLAILFHAAADAAPHPQFADARDGRAYPVVRIAGMEWLGRNLEYAMPDSHCLDDDEENCAQLGRLYTWDDAMRACPEGWHLSTEQEWRRLEVHLGMPAEELDRTRGRGEGVGDTLKIGGSSGLDIPFGGWRRPDGEFRAGNGIGRAAALWVATESDPESAWHRDLSTERSVIWRSPVSKPYSLSVRCVRD